MSYEVTATRRRPQYFDDLVGQEFVAETLKNSIKSGKIAHAYLFSGPRGCGKTSTARILAKALNCQKGPAANPCGQCSNCQEITKGTSLDVIEIDGASNTSVENIRQIKDEVLFPPSNSKYKIYIIDEVHMLSTSAFNALLKTIEEPPPYVIFIFATTELQKVPATIKSRCQQFNFRLVAIEKVKQCLADAAKELNIQADDEALFWIARESTGSMRDAYTLFDQVVAFSDGHITYENIRDKLGLVGIDRLNTIFEACAQNKPDDVMSLLDQFIQGGISIEQLISNCSDYLRSILLIKNNVKKESLLGNSPERYSSVVLQSWNTVQAERALSIFLQLYRDIRYSISPRYEIELAFSRLCWIGKYVSGAEVKKAIDDASSLLMGASKSGTATVFNRESFHTEKKADTSLNESHESSENKNTSENVSKPDNYIPAGLPRFSMLDSITENGSEEDKLSSVFDSGLDNNSKTGKEIAENTDNAPFPDGGQLPPEPAISEKEKQSEPVNEKEEKASAEIPPVIDERLKINIPQKNIIDGNVLPSVEVPESETGYTVNPDMPNDEWSNMDEPPEDDYYPDDSELEEEATMLEESYKTSGIITEPENTVSLKNDKDNSLITASGKNITSEELKAGIIKDFTIKDSFIASALEKTGIWNIKSDSVDTYVSNAYDLELLKNKIPAVSSSISAICGKNMYFNVALQEQEEEKNKEPCKLPSQVNMLLDTFKGTLVAGKL